MDAGAEIVLFRKRCAENNIKTYLRYSSFHGSFIEMSNQSIRNRMNRWMDTNKTERYIYSLVSLLEGYYNSYNSSAGIPHNVARNNKYTNAQIKTNLQKC